MKIDLTDEQAEEIAIAWIKDQQRVADGYKKVMDTLLMGALFATWSWVDALKYATMKCAKAYACTVKQIVESLK